MEIKKNLIFGTGKKIEVQADKQSAVEKADASAVQPETKELGAKLLEQPSYIGRHIVKTAIAKEDAQDLTQLFNLAGIKAPMPSKEVYGRIAANTASAQNNIDELTTTNNMEEFFTKGHGRFFV